MIFVVLYKYLNFAVDKIIGTGHTTSTDCNTDYEIIQLMKLFITSWCKPLKIDPSREICTYVTWAKPFLPNTHLDELICVSYYSTWKCLILTGVSLGNVKDCFLISYLALPRPNLNLNGLLNKKDYMLKMMLPYPNLAANARVVSKRCSLLIITLNYHAQKTWYVYEYT